MKSNLGTRIEGIPQRGHILGNIFGQHVPSRVGDIHGLRPVGFHFLRFLCQTARSVQMRHHQKARGIHA